MTTVVHFEIDHCSLLDNALAEVRKQRSLPQDYVFHFSGSRPQIREAFFNHLRRVPFVAHARVVDKGLWTQPYIQKSRGIERIQAEIVELMIRCPEHFVSGQTLVIDGKKVEAKTITPIRTELNRRLAMSGRPGVRRVKACPDDHPSQGAILQVADMISGALHDARSVTGPSLGGLTSRIGLV